MSNVKIMGITEFSHINGTQIKKDAAPNSSIPKGALKIAASTKAASVVATRR